ncbi:MAG TPA: GUN4 domain-containing protein [Allocoleopsis sp.]
MPDENYYKVGGSLEYQHPTYVVRQADADLYEGLKNGEFCYVLNSRQMGKSSLRVQMMKKLKEQGVKCASIDMTRIGSHVTQAEWYAGVISELLRGFSLSRKVNFSSWWREREALPPLQRLRELIEDVLLVEFSQNLVIFVDEIDSIIKIKFKEDFFAFIRACYNQRVDNPEYNRLTFCLLGVATPSDLITDKNISTPFNIGRAIELTGFQLHEVQPLIQGLTGRVRKPDVVIREVLGWTGGQPFLTQKLCKQILNQEKSILEGIEAECVEELVRAYIIENWETQDEPEHLRTIRDRILWSSSKEQLLRLYQHILQTGEVRANDTPEHMELRLSGLVVKQQGKLKVYNRIYASVFNSTWIEITLGKLAKFNSSVQASNLTSKRILWVDDNPANIAYEITRLKEEGIEVTMALSTARAMQILVSGELSFNAIITDMGRTEEGEYRPHAGIVLIKAVRDASVNLPIFVYTTFKLYTRTINELIAAGGNGATRSAEQLLSWIRDYVNLTKEDNIEGDLASRSSIPVVVDRLNSAFEIDYNRLRSLLARGQWLEADLETITIMLRICDRETEGWLREEDFEYFPCTDLLTIDQLWIKYSNGRFGFSVQKEIWQSIGGTKNTKINIYRSFCELIGWSVRGSSWLFYSDLTFDSTASVGHLPGALLKWLWSSLYRRSWWNLISSMACRLEECSIQSSDLTSLEE